MISSIKSLIKNLIPFYNSYVKSRQSTIHNQTYWGYVSFRLLGCCSLGGISRSIVPVRYPISGRFM